MNSFISLDRRLQLPKAKAKHNAHHLVDDGTWSSSTRYAGTLKESLDGPFHHCLIQWSTSTNILAQNYLLLYKTGTLMLR